MFNFLVNYVLVTMATDTVNKTNRHLSVYGASSPTVLTILLLARALLGGTQTLNGTNTQIEETCLNSGLT